MRGSIGGRVAQIFPTLFIVSILIFCLQQMMPGDPAAAIAGEYQRPELIAEIRKQLFLDRPLPEQYFHWITRVFHGDLGYSWFMKQPVVNLLLQKLPVTMQLSVMAFVIAVCIGIPAGVLAAVKKDSVWDHIVNGIGLASMSVPHFWLGIVLILLVSIHLGWLPASGYVPIWTDWLQSLKTTIMPAFVLGTAVSASLMRHTRSAMLMVLNQDFVRTARAKGVKEHRIILHHALRNALMPVVTLGAIELGQLLSGAVLTEQIFSIPGLGKLMVDSVFNRDYPVVQGVVLVTAFIYVVLSLLADILYIFINPRLRSRA